MSRSTDSLDSKVSLPESLLHQVTDQRVENPELAVSEAQNRVRRSALTPGDRLLILAADHPGRGVTRAGENPVGMGGRHEYLARIVRVLTTDAVDAIMSTPDILDELLTLNALLRKEHGPLLDGKLLIGSMNRGGIGGTVFEMDDRFDSAHSRHDTFTTPE